MGTVPQVIARYETRRTQAALVPVDLGGDETPEAVLAFRQGRLRAYDLAGRRLWEATRERMNYFRLTSASDLDGDGRKELVLEAGNPGRRANVVAVLDACTGGLRCKLPFAGGTYSWVVRAGNLVSDLVGEQIVLVNSMQTSNSKATQGKKGFIALWSFEAGADRPRRRWYYEPEGFQVEYPAVFVEDLDCDGRPDLFVTHWCYMYWMNLTTGRARQHFGWTPQKANKRHYGWNQLVDVDGDGDLDYVCLAATKHVDLLRNEGRQFSLAWTFGLGDSVTSSRYYMAHAPWPAMDLDGDRKLEVIYSLFNEHESGRWRLLVRGSERGDELASFDDLVPRAALDLDGDGSLEILATRHSDMNLLAWEAVEVIDRQAGGLRRRTIDGATGFVTTYPKTPSTVFLSSSTAYIRQQVVSEERAGGGRRAWLRFGQEVLAVHLDADGALVRKALPVPRSPVLKHDLSRIPMDGGIRPDPLLVADLDGNGANEIVLKGKPAQVLSLRDGKLTPAGTLPAEGPPIVWDMNGDGVPEIVAGGLRPDGNLEAMLLNGATREPIWRKSLPDSAMSGRVHGIRAMHFAVGRFRGKETYDVYVYVVKPGCRAMVLRGEDGGTVWETKETMPGTQQHYGPYSAACSVYDINGDGADDLLFASPSFLACISGRDGALLRNPKHIYYMLSAPSLYSSPVLCPQPRGLPVIQIAKASSATGALPIGEEPDWPSALWKQPLEVREWHTGAEAVFRDARRPEHWCTAWPDESGWLHCREVETGKQRWRYRLGGLTNDPATCDIDGDGQDEIIITGSDGCVVALRDAGGRPEVLWKVGLGMPAGAPILGDVNGDGASEILVGTAEGVLFVLGQGGKQ